MTTLCRAYATTDEAVAAVTRLLDAGTPGEDVRVLMGERVHDHAESPAGGYAGTAGGSARVGAFAGAGGSGRASMGAYASGGDGRRGSFADLDRDTVATYAGGVRHVRVAEHRDIEALLADAGLDRRAARADVGALHRGRVLVLVRTDAPAAATDALAGGSVAEAQA